MLSKTLQSLVEKYKEHHLYHRYICGKHIQPLLEKHGKYFDIKIIGTSVLGQPIHVIKIGSGNTKILMWSQMHGNESTTTKAVFDLCNIFADPYGHVGGSIVQHILKQCSIAIIPILNPDGAEAYTRLNANMVDLNRDNQSLTQPESKILRQFFDDFKPDFCFNLHGQRTIFSAGNTNNPATVSFLAPAQDELCTVTQTRKKAMEIIVVMDNNLQLQIPNQVGTYDDAFNINCVGDTFQSLNVPTILFEAGHYQKDYEREKVRGYMAQSMLVAIHYIAVNEVIGDAYRPYFNIPRNEKLCYDIIIRNVIVDMQQTDIAIQYEERLLDDKIEFVPKIEQIGNLDKFFGHKEVDAKGESITTMTGEPIYVGFENDFVLIKNKLLSLKA